MGKPTDRELLEAAMQVATVAMIREATLRRFLIEKGVISLAELVEFRAEQMGSIETEVRTALDKEIEKAARGRKQELEPISDTATRHHLTADPIADTAVKASARRK